MSKYRDVLHGFFPLEWQAMLTLGHTQKTQLSRLPNRFESIVGKSKAQKMDNRTLSRAGTHLEGYPLIFEQPVNIIIVQCPIPFLESKADLENEFDSIALRKSYQFTVLCN